MGLIPSFLLRRAAERAMAACERKAADLIVAILKTHGVVTSVQVDTNGTNWISDVLIVRHNGGYRVSFAKHSPPNYLLDRREFIAAYLYWLDACPAEVTRLSVEVSDGNIPSRARFGSSTRTNEKIAIPDPTFFLSRSFAQDRARALEAPAWDERSDDVVWRGHLNGFGEIAFDVAEAHTPTVNARNRMVLLFRDAPQSDVLLTGVGWFFANWDRVARESGLIGTPMPAESWLRRRYAIDIDGFTNTWSNLLIRMLYGCCVFKVDSQLGFRQWYYDRIKPFEHYIPVRADMSDMFEQIEWARSHPKEAQEIAAAGQRFAMELDFEAGKRDAVEIITANWDKTGHDARY